MTEHLAGPESDAEVLTRHNNYLQYWLDGRARMFAIEADGTAVGGIGWWSTEWNDLAVHETGWFVVAEAQGRGIARAAVGLTIADAAAHGTASALVAFPSVTNAPSNGLCASSGFVLQGAEEFPFRGEVLQVNAWALDLNALRAPSL